MRLYDYEASLRQVLPLLHKKEISSLDIAILRELRENCKQPISAIANKINAHPSTVMERIRKLEKVGIIKRYQAHINYGKLGFNVHAFVSLQFKGVGSTDILDEVGAIPEVAGLFWVTGLIDAVGIIRTTTREALSTILERFAKNKRIARTRTDMVFETYKYHHEFDPFSVKEPMAKEKKLVREKSTYDNLDLAILRELKENAKIRYKELAQKLKTHQNTLVHRINRLEESGIILKYAADIDYHKLGYAISAITMLRLKSSEIPSKEIAMSIASIPEVKAFYEITGNYDYMALIRAKTIQDLSMVLQEMFKRGKVVKRSSTLIALYTYKDPCEYNPFLNMPLLEHEM